MYHSVYMEISKCPIQNSNTLYHDHPILFEHSISEFKIFGVVKNKDIGALNSILYITLIYSSDNFFGVDFG